MNSNDKYLIAAFILFMPFVFENLNYLFWFDRLNMMNYIPPLLPAALAIVGIVPFSLWFWKVMKE